VQSVLFKYVVDTWISPFGGGPQVVISPLLQPVIFVVPVKVVQELSLNVNLTASVPLQPR